MQFDPKQEFNETPDHGTETKSDNSSIAYDFNSVDFNKEPQFQEFDYERSSAHNLPYSVGLQGDSFYTSMNYTRRILTPCYDNENMKYSDLSNHFEDEPPLLEELGINFHRIWKKTLAVLNPFKAPDASILQESDLTGPLVFYFTFGIFLLLKGKVQFGYIYGIGILGCFMMFLLLNLMSESGISFGCTISVLGYCSLPMVFFSILSIVLSDKTILFTFSSISVLWCCLSASNIFVTALEMNHQQPLIAYPCAILYGIFALLTVF